MASNFTRKTKKLRAENSLTGTISLTAASTTVNGVGTKFLTEVGSAGAVTDRFLWANGLMLQVASVTSDTVLVLSAVPGATAAAITGKISGGTLYKVLPGVSVSIIHSLFVSNNNESTPRKFITRFKDSTTREWVTFTSKLEVPVENTFSSPKPINMLTGDEIYVAADGGVDYDLHIYASIVEKS